MTVVKVDAATLAFQRITFLSKVSRNECSYRWLFDFFSNEKTETSTPDAFHCRWPGIYVHIDLKKFFFKLFPNPGNLTASKLVFKVSSIEGGRPD